MGGVESTSTTFLISHDQIDPYDPTSNVIQIMSILIVMDLYFLYNLSLTRIDIIKSQCEMLVPLDHAQSLEISNSFKTHKYLTFSKK